MSRRAALHRRVAPLLLALAWAACKDAVDPTSPARMSVHAADTSVEAQIAAARDIPEHEVDAPVQSNARNLSVEDLRTLLFDANGEVMIGLKAHAAPRTVDNRRLTQMLDRVEVDAVADVGVRSEMKRGEILATIAAIRAQGIVVSRYWASLGILRARLTLDQVLAVRALPGVDFVYPVPPTGWEMASDLAPARSRWNEVPSASLMANAAEGFQNIDWGVTLMRAPQAWAISRGAGARVSIIDTGFERGHEDLPLPPSANCGGPLTGCADDPPNGHGTPIAGIIVARDNSFGFVGVAPGVDDDAFRSWGACSANTKGVVSCTTDYVITGLDWTITNMPNAVVNLSYVHSSIFPGEADAVGRAISAGLIVVAAVGNTNVESVKYPAGYTNVIGVSGLYRDKSFAEVSAFSECPTGSSWSSATVDYAAPYQARNARPGNSYGSNCGTSFAAPHVAGAIALVRAKHPTWSLHQITEQLEATSEDLLYNGDIMTKGKDARFGYGLIRADLAVGLWRTSITASISNGRPLITWQPVPLATSYIVRRLVGNASPYGYFDYSTTTGLSFSDCTRVSGFAGYDRPVGASPLGVSYQVWAVSADGIKREAAQYASYWVYPTSNDNIYC